MGRSSALFPTVLLVFASCASAPPAAVLHPSAAPGLTVEIGTSAQGVSPVRLSGGVLGGGVITGEAQPEGSGWRLSLRRLDWFNNWANGWTQASFLFDASVLAQPAGGGWTMTATAAPQLDAVDSASIRYFDTYVRGDKGQLEFTRRWNRIEAVCAGLKPMDLRALERFLFPELYGYGTPPAPGHGRVTVQGFEWDTDYTKAHFAEPLRVLRDSGTLLRDYKESPGLWLLALQWKDLWK